MDETKLHFIIWRCKMRYRIIFCLVLCLLLVGCKEDTLGDSVIVFYDATIETETRRILDKPEGDITTQDVLTIIAFGDDGDGGKFGTISGDITTLEDLKWFLNLERIVLSGCNISSLNGIENLTSLQKLFVRQNNISSLEPIRNLTNLIKFDCSDNNISDYSPLSGLINLEELCIGSNGVSGTDISVLENLTRLKSLYAPWCGIDDISVLSNMPDLEYLQLHHNNIINIDSLKTLEKLTYLELGSNKIVDISPIENFVQLKHINLQNNFIPENMLKKFNEPKEEDYVTTKINNKIHDDLPEYTFELISYFNRENNHYAAQTLTITDSSTEEIIQTISIPMLSWCGQTSIYGGEDMGLVFEDLNFDGYTDIRLFDTTNGNYKVEWIYWVWEPDKGLFKNDKRLNKISLATFNQEEQLIYGMDRGSAADHYYQTYKYIDGEPTLIEYYSENYITMNTKVLICLETANINTEDSDIMGFHEVVSERNDKTGEMEITRDEYVFYPKSDIIDQKTIIARFDISSEIGKMIAGD